MKNIGIVFGSTTGTCESLAATVAEKLGVSADNVLNVTDLTADKAESYDVLVLGSSTWGDGELQDDWYDGLSVLKSANLSGKTVALFACGDSDSYSSTFCDAMAELKAGLASSGVTFVGAVDASAYSYDDSRAVEDGKFIGLAIDDVNESSKTDARVSAWAEALKPYLA